MNVAKKVIQPPSTVKIVNKTLRRLLLKVHPDFFHSIPEKKELNQRSLQQLNRILGPLLKKGEGKANALESLLRSPVEVSFYTKEGNLVQQTFSISSLKEYPHSQEQISKQLPTHETENFLSSKLTLEFLQYCQQFEIPNVKNDIERLEEYLKNLQEQYSRENQQSLPKGKTLKEIFEKGLRSSFSNPHTQSKSSISRMKNLRTIEDEWKTIFQTSNLVFKHKDISSIEYHRCKEALSKHLVELGYAQWRNLPLMISTEFSRTIPGFLVFPNTFEKSEVQHYLETHLENIREEYTELIRSKMPGSLKTSNKTF
ncbi:hypothetical protein K7432_003285 [Basidiobolus ranarum]|uniref:DUF4460 domain-containing protein n=1 Tax=Basidiobolus ranarum TaxID=34480 RepID=A0ABR2W7C6_9FUNG